MLMEDVVTKLKEKIEELTVLEKNIEAKGFAVPSELKTRREELIRVTAGDNVDAINYDHVLFNDVSIIDCIGNGHIHFDAFWRSAKSVLAIREEEQAAVVEIRGTPSTTLKCEIDRRKEVIKVLENIFPEEVKAIEAQPTPAVAITPQTMTGGRTIIRSNHTCTHECMVNIRLTPQMLDSARKVSGGAVDDPSNHTCTPQMVATTARLCGIPPLTYSERTSECTCTPIMIGGGAVDRLTHTCTPQSVKEYAERVYAEYKEWKRGECPDPEKNPTQKLRKVVNALFEVAPGAFHDIIYNPSTEPSLGPKIFISNTWQYQYNNLIKEMQKLIANTRK
jgi:hypothetical protein